MIILGVDPGSRITGYGLIKKTGAKITHLENGSLYCTDQNVFSQRLLFIFEQLQAMIQKFKPTVVAVENLFYHNNPKSLQKLSEVRGVIIFSAAYAGLPVFEYTALQVKKAVTGYGVAEKQQMQKMVSKLLQLKDLPEENASDALGVALCHAHSMQGGVQQTDKFKNKKKNIMQELLKNASFYR